MPGSNHLLQKFASVSASPALTFIAQIPKVSAPYLLLPWQNHDQISGSFDWGEAYLYPGPWPPEDIHVLVWGRGGGKEYKRIIHSYSQPWSHTPGGSRTTPGSSLHVTMSADPPTTLRLATWVWHTHLVPRSIHLAPISSITRQRGWVWRQPLSQSCFLTFPCLVAPCTCSSLQIARLAQGGLHHPTAAGHRRQP